MTLKPLENEWRRCTRFSNGDRMHPEDPWRIMALKWAISARTAAPKPVDPVSSIGRLADTAPQEIPDQEWDRHDADRLIKGAR
jgi:hypothetical protein